MIPVGNQPSFASTSVESLPNGNYQVTTEGEEPQVMNEAAVNEKLAPYGLKMVDGATQSLDNFAINNNNAAVVTNYADQPLPDIEGDALSTQALSEQISGRDFGDMSLGAMTWMALSEMSRSSMRDQQDAKQIRNTMQKMKMDAKTQEISQTEEKIEAERGAAWAQFATSCAAAVVNVGVTGWGSSMGMNQFMAQAVGSGGSQVISSFGTAMDKQAGFQATADEKQIRVQELQQLQESLDMAIDDARSTYDESKDQFKQAQKLLTDYVDRQTQIVQTITR